LPKPTLYIIVSPFRLSAYRPLRRGCGFRGDLAADAAQASGSGAHSTLCDETGNLGRIEALLMATTLLRSWGLTVWTFWQTRRSSRLTVLKQILDNATSNSGIQHLCRNSRGGPHGRLNRDLGFRVSTRRSDSLDFAYRWHRNQTFQR
jgi:hypothetical protein